MHLCETYGLDIRTLQLASYYQVASQSGKQATKFIGIGIHEALLESVAGILASASDIAYGICQYLQFLASEWQAHHTVFLKV